MSTEAFSQNGKATERQVTGTWTMDLGKSKSRMTQDKRSALNDLDAQTRNRIESKYKNRELIFRKDKTFSMIINGDEVITGDWKIAPNGKRIVVVPERGENYRYDIVSINANRLRIKPRVKSENNLLFPEWHLVKK
ncbi:hypothetical protein BFP97_12510 [Roseivirga sp. 4D4]|nr:hypothetical protein BFP97_12510 [Roseivirga sp. 4D4]